jgi:pimeloyl-ACP methyl ester carboxylesterase
MKAGYRVIVPSARGHGLSGLGHGELSYRLPASDDISVLNINTKGYSRPDVNCYNSTMPREMAAQINNQ